ncbi:MAG: hypothetical protein ACK5VI_10740 [Opitutia bacterium]|jgi:hypothetical protein
MRDLPLGPERDPLRDAVKRMGTTANDQRKLVDDDEPDSFRRSTVVPPPQPSRAKLPSAEEVRYLQLGGVWLSKRQVHAAIATDLPALLAELAQGKTLRAKFMNIVLAPLVKDYVSAILNGQFDGKDYSDTLP